MRATLKFLMLAVTIFAFSCKEEEVGNSTDVNPETIFFDYKISGEEGRDYVTCMIQYRYGGDDGTTLVLAEPSKVELDGEELKVDSAKYTGAYYEVQKPLAQFAGQHTITFTDAAKKQYKEEFRFQPLSLRDELPEKVKRDSFSIYLNEVEPGTRVRYVLTGTAFQSDDINEVQKMSGDGRIILTKAEMEKLKPGPVTLLLTLEEERPVKKGTKEGGRISISYALRREFDLVNK
jgi:hypothetical protein